MKSFHQFEGMCMSPLLDTVMVEVSKGALTIY